MEKGIDTKSYRNNKIKMENHKVRFRENGIDVFDSIKDLTDLKTLIKNRKIKSVIECKMNSNMSMSLHNAIAKHNSKYPS